MGEWEHNNYHDDCLEKKPNLFCILNWGMAVSCSRNMNFVKCRVSQTSEENFSMFDIFLDFFLKNVPFADQVELTKLPPYILIFHLVTLQPPPPPFTQQYLFPDPPLENTPPPVPHLRINDWSHRSCSFLNILLFKILSQSC